MDIYEVVENQRAALLKREYRTVQGIVRAYEKAERSIEKSIRRYQAKIAQAQKTGTPVSLAWVYQEVRLENILREIRLQLEEFSKDALEFSQTARDDAYQLGAVHALRLAEASVIGDIAGLHSGAFASAQALLSAQSPLKDLFDKIAPMATEAARETFAEAISQGWNPRKTGRVLKNRIQGLTKDRAVLIARTEQIRAYRTANQDVYRRNSDVLRGWRWTSAKTPATCAMCLALDGTIFPVDKVLSSHPACRCSMVPLPKTDFGGPEPTLGEDYFAKLDPKEQDRILGKGKGKLYREGKITLKDNVDFTDNPDWGRQPKPRRLTELRDLHAKRRLPSQLGPVNLSGYTPPAARKLSDLLDAAERKANDPVQKALTAWDNAPSDARGRRVGLKADRATYKKAAPKDLRASEIASTIEEVDINLLVASTQYPPDQKVRDYIRSMGDGPDLPLVVRQGARLWVHDNDSLARLEAKRLLGQTKAGVRIFNADDFTRPVDPLQDIKDELRTLGVKDFRNVALDLQRAGITPPAVDERAALEWARDRIKASGHAPREVWYGAQETAVSRDGLGLIVGPEFQGEYQAVTGAALRDKVDNSVLSILDPKLSQDRALFDFKVPTYRATNNVSENIEAALIRERLGLGRSKGSKTLEDFAKSRGRLFSVRAFENSDLGEAVEEMIVQYRRGEYVLGSLPDGIEGPTLKELRRVIGDRPVKTMSDEERILGLQIGAQGGSNPGGMYLGVDGVRRYVKFYPQADRAEAEVLANKVYESLGIAVPKSVAFQSGGKSAFASEIIEGGKTLQQLGGIAGVDKKLLEEALDGYVADALLANWDVVGLSADNMMVAGGKVYRIDNGGTFIFRAQGGDKADSILQGFEELDSLGGVSTKGYDGQFKPILKRLGYSDVSEIEDKIETQGKTVLKFLESVTKGETTTTGRLRAWETWVKTQTPTMSDQATRRIAQMMDARTTLLREKLEWIKASKKPLKKRPSKVKAEGVWDVSGDKATRAAYEKLIARPAYVVQAETAEAYKAAGFTANEINDIKSFISGWTAGYKSGGPQTRSYRYARNFFKGLAPKTPEEKLFHKVLATRNERLRYILDKNNLQKVKVPQTYRAWRAHKNDREAIAEIINAWEADRDPRIRVFETASWAHEPSATVKDWDKFPKPGSGAASNFLSDGSLAIMYSIDIDHTNVFVDLIADDSTFVSTFLSEREIIPAFPKANHPVANDLVEVWIGRKRYRKADLAKVKAAFRARYGVDPKDVFIDFSDDRPLWAKAFGFGMSREEAAFINAPEGRIPILSSYAVDDPANHIPDNPHGDPGYLEIDDEVSTWGRMWT